MNRFLILSFLILISLSVHAQRFAWGFHVGPSFGFASGTSNNGLAVDGAETVTGFHAGLMAQYNPRRFFSIITGASYVTKGVRFSSTLNEWRYSSANNELRLAYVEIPILVKLNFDPYSAARPNVFFGPNLGFLASARDNYLLPQSSIEQGNQLVDTERYYRPFDGGLYVGAGIDLDVGNWTIFSMGLSYIYGTQQVNKNDGYYYADESELMASNLRLHFGLMFVIPTYTFNNTKKIENFDKFKQYLY